MSEARGTRVVPGEEELAKVIRLLDIRIRLDEFEDSLIESLEHIRILLEREELDGAKEELSSLISLMQEDIEATEREDE